MYLFDDTEAKRAYDFNIMLVRGTMAGSSESSGTLPGWNVNWVELSADSSETRVQIVPYQTWLMMVTMIDNEDQWKK